MVKSMRRNMIIWINNYIDKEKNGGKDFINKISIEEKIKKENEVSDKQ